VLPLAPGKLGTDKKKKIGTPGGERGVWGPLICREVKRLGGGVPGGDLLGGVEQRGSHPSAERKKKGSGGGRHDHGGVVPSLSPRCAEMVGKEGAKKNRRGPWSEKKLGQGDKTGKGREFPNSLGHRRWHRQKGEVRRGGGRILYVALSAEDEGGGRKRNGTYSRVPEGAK